MQILVNGQSLETGDQARLSELLRQLDLEGKRLAVEVNEELVPRSTFEDFRLSPEDRVEIVRAIGGG